jgi:hypothetical protein
MPVWGYMQKPENWDDLSSDHPRVLIISAYARVCAQLAPGVAVSSARIAAFGDQEIWLRLLSASSSTALPFWLELLDAGFDEAVDGAGFVELVEVVNALPAYLEAAKARNASINFYARLTSF